jgi:hypothetical protein
MKMMGGLFYIIFLLFFSFFIKNETKILLMTLNRLVIVNSKEKNIYFIYLTFNLKKNERKKKEHSLLVLLFLFLNCNNYFILIEHNYI